MADNEVPKHIKSFYNRHKKADLMIHETGLAHMDAYLHAQGKLIDGKKREDGTERDITDLEDEKFAEDYVNEMAKRYISRIRKRWGLKDEEKWHDMDEEVLMEAYMGVSKSQLMIDVKNLGKDYTSTQHTAMAQRWMQPLGKKLKAVASAPIEDKHGKDVFDYMKSLGHKVDFLDPNKLRAGELVDILLKYEKGKGALPTQDDYRKHIAYKKEKKKELVGAN